MCKSMISIDPYMGMYMIVILIKCLIYHYLTKEPIYHRLIKTIKSKKIATADHCYGCTAGTGSSCWRIINSIDEIFYSHTNPK